MSKYLTCGTLPWELLKLSSAVTCPTGDHREKCVYQCQLELKAIIKAHGTKTKFVLKKRQRVGVRCVRVKYNIVLMVGPVLYMCILIMSLTACV